MKIYVLNAFSLAMLPPQGATVKVAPISLEEVKSLLREGNFESAVGHASTAEILTLLTGVQIPVNRVAIALGPGSRAVVFQLRTRLDEGRVLSMEEVQDLYNRGLASFFIVEVVG
ncbi:MAG: DUF1874 domain-containing protein [Thermodesulfobacterium sp.]|jgi:hypothetical protein|nr:DUF1874 domain-containing protein [Thermodesulfobacterium sp.]